MLPDAAGRDVADDVHSTLVGEAPEAPLDAASVAARVRASNPLLPDATVDAIARDVEARTSGLGPLEPLLADPSVTEVMVNPGGDVWTERHGRLARERHPIDTRTVELLIERVVGPLGLRVDRSSPLADARLADGSRVNVVVPPLAIDGPCLTIRRFGARSISLGDACPPGVEALLRWATRARSNVVVSGGTGAGKTTLLNALAGLLARHERIVTVEETAELRLPGAHVVRLEARPASADGLGAVPLRALVRNALRMRPDRIVVGEVRGAEAVDMLWAMNTGHEGSLSTCHANSLPDALRRLELMVLSAGLDLPLEAVREQITAAIDLIVQVARAADGSRRVVGVGEVIDPPPASGPRVRELADPSGLHSLPTRPPRDGGCEPPEPGWCR